MITILIFEQVVKHVRKPHLKKKGSSLVDAERENKNG